MAVTGMRIGEVIRLDRSDVDLDQKVLTVRLTKFSKSRLIPLHPTTVQNLEQYLRQLNQLQPRSTAPNFFLSNQGIALTDCMVRWTFVKLSRQIGLSEKCRIGREAYVAKDTVCYFFCGAERSGSVLPDHLLYTQFSPCCLTT